jgi:hypothetical protein
MEVVKQSLAALEAEPNLRSFFLAKLSASGRGESDPVSEHASDDDNRRVVFKIRIKSDQAQSAVTSAMTRENLNSQHRNSW